MVIFGTIGLFRKNVPLPSSLIALTRGIIGSLILFAVSRFYKVHVSRDAIGKNLLPLLLSGTALGFNWILLFESYNYTTVATATLCYYLAPVIVILMAPFAIHESIKRKQLFWVCMALVGMAMVSGVFSGSQSDSQMKGILFGLASAVLYAFIVLMNKRIHQIPSLTKTLVQLFISAVTMLPYVLIREDFSAMAFSGSTIALLLVMGIVHTGIAYWLYFASVEKLEAHTVALFSYIDPVVAIVVSTLLLGEELTLLGGIGAAVILLSAYFCEKS